MGAIEVVIEDVGEGRCKESMADPSSTFTSTCTESESEVDLKLMRSILGKNQDCAGVLLMLSFIILPISLLIIFLIKRDNILNDKRVTGMLLVSAIWMWICACTMIVNSYFARHVKLDKVNKWRRRKLLQISAVLPYQDRSQVLKVLHQLNEKENEKEQPQASSIV